MPSPSPLRRDSTNVPDLATRRGFFVAAAGACTASIVMPVESSGAMGRDDKICRSRWKEYDQGLTKLYDTRYLMDMAVQASSVQAWPTAVEILNDPLFDPSSLDTLFGNCNNKAVPEVLRSIESMRNALNRGDLTANDAVQVMRYGTSARANIDAIFGI